MAHRAENDFLRETGFTGAGEALRLVERFTRPESGTLVYEFTIEDPHHFTQPWTAVIPMRRNLEPMFEYACHEGNYGMTNLLAGARADDRAVTASSSESR